MSKLTRWLVAVSILAVILVLAGCGTDLTTPRLAKISDLEGTWNATQYTEHYVSPTFDHTFDLLADTTAFVLIIGPDRGDGSASATTRFFHAGRVQNEGGSLFRVSGSDIIIANADGTNPFAAHYTFNGGTLQLSYATTDSALASTATYFLNLKKVIPA